MGANVRKGVFIRSNFNNQNLEIPEKETAPMVSLTASPAKLLSSTAKWAVWKQRLKKRSSLHTTKLDKIIQQWVHLVVQILPLQHEGNQQQPLLCCYFSPHPVHVGTWTYQFNHCSNLIPHLICLKTGFSFQIKSAHNPMCLETFMGQQAHVKGQVATAQPQKRLNWSPRCRDSTNSRRTSSF